MWKWIKKIGLGFIILVSALAGYQNLIAASVFSTNLVNSNEKFISAGDAQIFCRVVGKGNPLIVIHGGPGFTQDYLLPQMDALAENNLVIFYDQRGCGKSTGEISPETINLKTIVDDLEAIRRAFNFEKISVLGHSWGGFIAMNYAITYPEHLDKLILSNSMPASSEGLAQFIQEYMRRTAPYQAEITEIHNTQEFQNGDPETVERLQRLIVRTYCYVPEKAELLSVRMTATASINGAKVHEIIRNDIFEKPFNLHSSLEKLQIPTLIIHGDTDPIPPITAQNIHESISHSKYLLMKNCGHFPYVEDPIPYFQCINEFLN
jgi:proline iminopeptidase